jgi:HEAT repeat protein
LIALALVAIGIVLWLLLERTPAEPVYQGKELHTWLNDLITGPILQGDYAGPTHDAAADAIRHMGTNALPALLADLHTKDSGFKQELIEKLQKHPFLKPYIHEADERRGKAAEAFRVLGPLAKPAIPELVLILKDPETSEESAFCLAFIGADGIPLLVQALTNSDPQVRCCAAWAVGSEGAAARSAVPALLGMLNDPEVSVRGFVTNALWSINPAAATKAGVNVGASQSKGK